MANIINVTKSTIIAESARLLYFLKKLLPSKVNKNIWLFSESPAQAQENGYELYLWVKENAPEVDSYYILERSSPVIKKFSNDSNLLILGSFKQCLMMFEADRIISTHGLWQVPDELGILKKITRNNLKAKKVMLNHGVGFLKNGSKYYHKNNFLLNDLILTLSKKHSHIFTSLYGYKDSDLKITGYPRFDNMISSVENSPWKNTITLMPTFRDGMKNSISEFKETGLFKHIELILTDPTINELLIQSGSHLAIYLHQNIQECSDSFMTHESEHVKIIRQGDYSVTEILKFSKLLITDYSSVFFDFVYMGKPFISYQFDRESFLAARHEKPMLDIQNDLPGVVVDTHDELVRELSKYINNEFTLEDSYKQQAAEFFEYQDTNNRYRAYQAIKNI
jgi:CDP-glycerol glycerophosphotransferase